MRSADGPIFDYHGPDPGLNIECAWTLGQGIPGPGLNSGRGAGIQIADVESGYDLDHEDFCTCTLSNPPPGCNIHLARLEPIEQGFPLRLRHGTGALGILGAKENGFGWTGLVPDATLWFSTEQPDVTPGPSNDFMNATQRATALASAISVLEAGDVMVLEMQTRDEVTPNIALEEVPAEIEEFVWIQVCAAYQSGIIVVSAAGNGSVDLDSSHPLLNNWRTFTCDCSQSPCTQLPPGDSGAIIVGSGSFEICHDRQLSSCFGSRVNVQGWGEHIFTPGGVDDHYYPVPPVDVRQLYTSDYTFTSGATPMVAGTVAALQSLASNRAPPNNVRLTPLEMRNLLITTGRPQGSRISGHIGPFPDVARAAFALGMGTDANADGFPNECAFPSLTIIDINQNGIPDECDGTIASGSRYLTLTPGSGDDVLALQVRKDCDPPGDDPNDIVGYVTDVPNDFDSLADFEMLSSTPVCKQRGEWGSVRVKDVEIAPNQTYKSFTERRSGDCSQALGAPQQLGEEVLTWIWGDCAYNGVVDNDDILGLLNAFFGIYDYCSFEAADFMPVDPVPPSDPVIDVDDILAVLDAFQGAGYGGPEPCPGELFIGGGGAGGFAIGMESAPAVEITIQQLVGGNVTRMHLFLMPSSAEIRCFQIDWTVLLPAGTVLELVDLSIDESRSDYLFYNRFTWSAIDQRSGRMVACLPAGGVVLGVPGYVGSFTAHVGEGVDGGVSVPCQSTGIKIRDAMGQSLPVEILEGAIEIQESRSQP